MKVLVAGAGGQLGSAFLRALAGRAETAAFPRARLDIGVRADVLDAVRAAAPSVILNCAAYNAVDRAESEPAQARRVNEAGPANLAEAADAAGALLVHFSTDYVFDGAAGRFYTEDDEPRPLGVYGATKLAGERAAARARRSLVLRTSWLYGGRGGFTAKLDAWAAAGDALRMAADQASGPTWAADIVPHALAAVERGLFGLFHLADGGYATRYEWARAYFRLLRRDALILPVPASAFPSAARRPAFSPLDTGRLRRELGAGIADWEDALARFVAEGGADA